MGWANGEYEIHKRKHQDITPGPTTPAAKEPPPPKQPDAENVSANTGIGAQIDAALDKSIAQVKAPQKTQIQANNAIITPFVASWVPCYPQKTQIQANNAIIEKTPTPAPQTRREKYKAAYARADANRVKKLKKEGKIRGKRGRPPNKRLNKPMGL